MDASVEGAVNEGGAGVGSQPPLPFTSLASDCCCYFYRPLHKFWLFHEWVVWIDGWIEGHTGPVWTVLVVSSALVERVCPPPVVVVVVVATAVVVPNGKSRP